MRHNSNTKNLGWMILLDILAIVFMIRALFIYYDKEYARAVFWLVLSVSMHLESIIKEQHER